jgi:hypothetical protein
MIPSVESFTSATEAAVTLKTSQLQSKPSPAMGVSILVEMVDRPFRQGFPTTRISLWVPMAANTSQATIAFVASPLMASSTQLPAMEPMTVPENVGQVAQRPDIQAMADLPQQLVSMPPAKWFSSRMEVTALRTALESDG